MRTRYLWLLFVVTFTVAHASEIYGGYVNLDEDEGECLEWGYEPDVELLFPHFGESTSQPLTDGGIYDDIEFLAAEPSKQVLLSDVDFHAPTFQASQPRKQVVEEWPAELPAESPAELPEMFFAPSFEAVTSKASVQDGIYDDIELLAEEKPSKQVLLSDVDFHAPTFQASQPRKQVVKPWPTELPAELPEMFFAPSFEAVTPKAPVQEDTYDDIELLAEEKPKKQVPPSDVDFHAPTFQASEPEPPKQVVEEWPAERPAKLPAESPVELPEMFHAPPFEQQQGPPKPKDVYAPLFEKPLPIRTTMQPEVVMRKKEFKEKPHSYQRIKASSLQDGFAPVDVYETVVEPAYLPPESADVHDEFVNEQHEKKEKHEEKKKYDKERKPQSYKRIKAPIEDSFAPNDLFKTIVEPAYLPPESATVHDEFVSEKHEKEEKKYKEQPGVFERLFGPSSGPVSQFFLDLIGAEAPVNDGFVQGLDEKTVVEEVTDYPAPKASIQDEFTVERDDHEDDKSDYRSKRSANGALANSSSNPGIWKMVCLKRRPKLKPLPRVLTAADFMEYAEATSNYISRCIGRREGENVASGLCRKFYLRCEPTISVLMCTSMNEVFSEANKTCVPKASLTECRAARKLAFQKISFSTKTNGKPEGEALFDGNTIEFCADKKDAFYRDPKDCSRVLQCFDHDLVEYPSCQNSLVYDLKRNQCDYRENVASCAKKDN